MSYADQEYCDIDMPQDLSAKYKSVSVQTDKCGENNVEELFEGFSQMQIRTVMDILVQFVKNKDSESIASSVPFVPEYCKVSMCMLSYKKNDSCGTASSGSA